MPQHGTIRDGSNLAFSPRRTNILARSTCRFASFPLTGLRWYTASMSRNVDPTFFMAYISSRTGSVTFPARGLPCLALILALNHFRALAL